MLAMSTHFILPADLEASPCEPGDFGMIHIYIYIYIYISTGLPVPIPGFTQGKCDFGLYL